MAKSVLIAVDPGNEMNRAFERFSAVVKRFQERKIIGQASIVSIVHPDLYVYPYSWYRERKRHFVKEALKKVTADCAGAFDFSSIKVLSSDTSAKELLVRKICRHGHRHAREVLVLASNDRTGLPHWILGSFSETAALTATLPLLIIKPHLALSDLSREARFVVGVDAIAPPPAAAVRWIADLAKTSDAHVDLVYASLKFRPGIDALQWRKVKADADKVLDGVQSKLRAAGVKASVTVLDETNSRARALVDFAEERKAWLTITVSAPRSLAHRLLLGSTSRQVLALTKRPFLSLRLEK